MEHIQSDFIREKISKKKLVVSEGDDQ